MRPPRPTSILPAAALLLAVPLGGCLNQSGTLIGAGPDPLPDLGWMPANAAAPATVSATARAPDGTTPVATLAPRTTSLDRSQWPVTVLHQPRGQVEWSFFGTNEPPWAVQRGPKALGPGES